MENIQTEQIIKSELIEEGQWVKPFAKTEKYEKLNPVTVRDYKISSGERVTIYLKDQEVPENVTATPKRKFLQVIVQNTKDKIAYEVEARFSKNPSASFVGIPEPAPSAQSFELWEPLNANTKTKPNPFTSQLMDMDDIEIKIGKIKY